MNKDTEKLLYANKNLNEALHTIRIYKNITNYTGYLGYLCYFGVINDNDKILLLNILPKHAIISVGRCFGSKSSFQINDLFEDKQMFNEIKEYRNKYCAHTDDNKNESIETISDNHTSVHDICISYDFMIKLENCIENINSKIIEKLYIPKKI